MRWIHFILVDGTAAGGFYPQHAIYHCCRAANADPDGNGFRRAIEGACSAFDTGILIGNAGLPMRYLKNSSWADGRAHSASGAHIAIQMQSHYLF